jgi:hypothetical protein
VLTPELAGHCKPCAYYKEITFIDALVNFSSELTNGREWWVCPPDFLFSFLSELWPLSWFGKVFEYASGYIEFNEIVVPDTVILKTLLVNCP